ncbi:MAG: hypothetical protein OTJ97_03085 [SAR202 cluster bacterium]|nr:hypothetical protein [SAR202 cluster bacterium]
MGRGGSAESALPSGLIHEGPEEEEDEDFQRASAEAHLSRETSPSLDDSSPGRTSIDEHFDGHSMISRPLAEYLGLSIRTIEDRSEVVRCGVVSPATADIASDESRVEFFDAEDMAQRDLRVLRGNQPVVGPPLRVTGEFAPVKNTHLDSRYQLVFRTGAEQASVHVVHRIREGWLQISEVSGRGPQQVRGLPSEYQFISVDSIQLIELLHVCGLSRVKDIRDRLYDLRACAYSGPTAVARSVVDAAVLLLGFPEFTDKYQFPATEEDRVALCRALNRQVREDDRRKLPGITGGGFMSAVGGYIQMRVSAFCWSWLYTAFTCKAVYARLFAIFAPLAILWSLYGNDQIWSFWADRDLAGIVDAVNPGPTAAAAMVTFVACYGRSSDFFDSFHYRAALSSFALGLGFVILHMLVTGTTWDAWTRLLHVTGSSVPKLLAAVVLPSVVALSLPLANALCPLLGYGSIGAAAIAGALGMTIQVCILRAGSGSRRFPQEPGARRWCTRYEILWTFVVIAAVTTLLVWSGVDAMSALAVLGHTAALVASSTEVSLRYALFLARLLHAVVGPTCLSGLSFVLGGMIVCATGFVTAGSRSVLTRYFSRLLPVW